MKTIKSGKAIPLPEKLGVGLPAPIQAKNPLLQKTSNNKYKQRKPIFEFQGKKKPWRVWEILGLVMGAIILAFLVGKGLSVETVQPEIVAMTAPAVTPEVEDYQKYLHFLREHGDRTIRVRDEKSGRLLIEFIVAVQDRGKIDEYFPELWNALNPIRQAIRENRPGSQTIRTDNYFIHYYVTDK